MGEGTVKGVTSVFYEEQLNDLGALGEGRERRGDTVLTDKVKLSDQAEIR